MLKRCSKCQIEKPESSFNKDQRSPNGTRMSICIECRTTANRNWRAKRSDYEKERYAKNPMLHREKHLKKKYGIGQSEYEQMFKHQAGKCAICGKSQKRAFDVDHCHDTKKVRGLLCSNCNRMIGHALDNPETLTRAAKYLRKSRLKSSKQLKE